MEGCEGGEWRRRVEEVCVWGGGISSKSSKMESEVEAASIKWAEDFFFLLLEMKVSGRCVKRSRYCYFSISFLEVVDF